MKVRDIVEIEPEKVDVCVPDDRLSEAAHILVPEGPGGIVPVVENVQDRKLIGVVKDTDLWFEAEKRDSADVSVGDCRMTPALACSPDDDLEQAVEWMCEQDVLHIAVVDRNDKILGVLAMMDVLHRSGSREAKAFERLLLKREP
ncbi:MAG TPA: CBS domain-containing protein [Nitrospiraceae bacterium]|jgi:predicted transcriptional regulator|nr:CBS domain-containing protein [Nitrospiraceae bacterium]